MGFVFADRTQETTSTTGFGTLSLLGAVQQYQAFSAGVGNGNQCAYTVLDGDGVHWFTAIGTYSSGTLTRDTILSGSNGAGANVSLSGSTPHLVYVDNVAATSTTLIGKYVTIAGDTSHTFSSIPQWFSDLELTVMGACTTTGSGATTNMSLQVNGLGTGIYSVQREYWPGSLTGDNADSTLAATSWDSNCAMPGTGFLANTPGLLRARIFDYTQTTFSKPIEWTGRQPQAAATNQAFSILGHALISTTAAITSLTVTIDTNQWAVGSIFTVRGIW